MPGGEPFSMPTEEPNPASRGIDRKETREVVEVIHREDRRAFDAAGAALDKVARAADLAVRSFKAGGRLIYVGAGTSGRLGLLDAVECPPTFGVEPDRVTGIMAGGDAAVRQAAEGAEDSPRAGAAAIEEARARDRDVVCGIAASGATPFVLGALEEARRRGAAPVLITCNPPGEAGARLADVVIELAVGPEVIAGSTRMKGGTATKLVLNMITTAAMIRWGKVYDNLMVDVRPTNQKLIRRATGLIARLGQVDPARAAELLALAGSEVKTAIVMARRGVEAEEARELLGAQGGNLRRVIG